ncbi:apolipoprotein D-like [Convolutriloba macropyga]|uniref:apolipoprotein D-like n=1 Tax=Convolutriloba macropyga TaxID=536237 RepID=UPI003F5241C8
MNSRSSVGCLILAVIVLSDHVTEGAVLPGQCVRVSPAKVTEENISGRWYELRRVHSSETYEKCNYDDYTLSPSTFRQIWFLKINSSFYSEGRYAHSIAKALQPHPSRFGISASFVLDTTWARAPANDEPNFFVLYVDNRFAIVYFCEEFGRMKLDLAWIMSRDRKAKKAELDDMETILHAHGLHPKMVDVDQENCPPQDSTR